jgi:hypothetical protein
MRDRGRTGIRAVCVVIGSLALAACGERGATGLKPAADLMLADAPAPAVAGQALIREHALELEVATAAIGPTVDRLVVACGERPSGECVLIA